MNPKISVIMLTYNRENLVERAILSVLSQTFADFEYIIVDNGSTDDSGKIADKFADRDSRIRVIHRDKGSIGSGRNTGLYAAKGDYIAFIDDDDRCEPDFLEFLFVLAAGNGADVSICGGKVDGKDFQECEKEIMTAEEAVIELMWRKKYNMAFPTKLFSREMAEKIRFPKEDKYDDITRMHMLLAQANKVAYHGLPKYTFYRHDSNNSAWTTNHNLIDSDILDEYLRAYKERTAWLAELFPNSAAIWRYFEWSFMISMLEKVARLEIKNCEQQSKNMLRELRKNSSEFLNCEWIQGFEKGWMDKYVLT